VLADGDTVDLTNLQRQILHRTDAGRHGKVGSGKRTLGEINPECQVVARSPNACPANASRGGRAGRHRARLLRQLRHAPRRQPRLRQVPQAPGVRRRDPLRRAGGGVRFTPAGRAPCYHCLFPEGQDVEEVRCAVMGVFAPITGIIGTVQAAEALKLVIGCGTSLAGRLLLLDGLGMEWREIRVPRDPGCGVCGAGSEKSLLA
jgi:molybdopterin/thiamine biosynthesis adenylyltransferase